MFIPTTLDYDRLHSVVDSIRSGLPTSRGEGRTLAYLYLMLGEAALGNMGNTYLYVAPNENMANWVSKEFAQLLHDEYGYGTVVSTTRNVVRTSHDQRYIFVGQRNIDCHIQGISLNRAFYDVQPSNREDLMEIYIHVKPDGDIL